MKRSTGLEFDNNLLKEWLLKIGRVRRQILLAKFRADLVRLSKLAWREGLLQLSSRPLVRLTRDIATKITERSYRMKGPKSKRKALQSTRDSNNNNDSINREFNHITNSLRSQKHVKHEKHDLDEKLDRTDSPKCSKSGISSMPRCAIDNSIKAVESGRRHCAASQKSKDSHKSIKKKKRRVPKEGENPNGVNWRLISIDMENPLTSPGPRFLHLRQAERKKKKDRLYAKFLEIFGEDIEPPETHKPNRTKDKTKERINETTRKCEDSEKAAQGTGQMVDRRSPTFGDTRRKRRQENRAAEKRKKRKSSERLNDSRDSISSDNASTKRGGITPVSEEEINSLIDDVTMANWPVSADPPLGDQETLNQQGAAVEESDADTRSTICIVGKTVETDDAADSSLGKEREGGKKADGEILGDLKRAVDSDQGSESVNEPQTLLGRKPETRQQSVIVRHEERSAEPREASFLASDSSLQETPPNTPNQEPDITQGTEDSSEPDDSISAIKAALDSPKLQREKSPEIPVSSCCENFKKEPEDQHDPDTSPSTGFQWASSPLSDQQPLNTGLSRSPSDVLEDDPNPSSTTDAEESSKLKSGDSCINDRLLGALDNIYLALHYRRRIQERVQTASKLAIKRNRQEEELKAQHDFESKLIILRDELRYLLNKLDTWDRVLRFVSQGLDHRTPAGVKRFSAAEVESAMLEAEVKPSLAIGKRKSSAVPKLQSVGRVLCTIDLTEDSRVDDRAKDLCDSSTDPPRSQNHPNTMERLEADSDADGFWTRDVNNDENQRPLPSIAEVKTISPQQFESFGDRAEFSKAKNDDPCYLCSRASYVACSQCAKATYCSKDCQLVHWERSHHATCVPFQRAIPRNV